jgi:glutamyl/glutaminyl-tRNA synthetase
MIYNTRIAPSPTGFAHLGTFRTAYHNWLMARATGGKFLFRIDDTDTERNQSNTILPLFDAMVWLGLDYDACFYQSKYMEYYRYIAFELVKNNLAEQLDDGAVRLIHPDSIPKFFYDSVAGEISITPSDIEHMKDIILLRSNGLPTYHFASVVDDHKWDINLILRGNDHISNTPRQILIWEALNKIEEPKDLPLFTHVGLLYYHNKKLSKRDNAASMLSYRDNGINADAMLNYILLLGWSMKDLPNIITKEMAIDLILLGIFKSSDAKMDLAKLESFSRKYKARLKGGRKGIGEL